MPACPNLQALCELEEGQGRSVGLKASDGYNWLVRDAKVRWREIVAVEIYDAAGAPIRRVKIGGLHDVERACRILLESV